MLAEQSADHLGHGFPQQKNWPLACCAVPVQITRDSGCKTLLVVAHLTTQALQGRMLPEEAGQRCPNTA